MQMTPHESEEPVEADPASAAEAKPAQATIDFEQVKAFVRRLGPAGPLALISGSMPFVMSALVLGSLPWVGAWMQVHRQAGALIYTLGFAALGGVGFMPTHAYSLLGGYAFGFSAGLALAMVSYVAAATIAYGVARLASGERIVEMIAEHPKSKAVYDALLGSRPGKTLLITFLIRLTSSPFAITNLALASARVNLVTYVAATAVGMIPRTGALVYIASLWGQTELEKGLKEGTPLPLTIAFTVVTFIVLCVIGYVGNQAIARVTGAGNGGEMRKGVDDGR